MERDRSQDCRIRVSFSYNCRPTPPSSEPQSSLNAPLPISSDWLPPTHTYLRQSSETAYQVPPEVSQTCPDSLKPRQSTLFRHPAGRSPRTPLESKMTSPKQRCLGLVILLWFGPVAGRRWRPIRFRSRALCSGRFPILNGSPQTSRNGSPKNTPLNFPPGRTPGINQIRSRHGFCMWRMTWNPHGRRRCLGQKRVACRADTPWNDRTGTVDRP